MPQAFVATRLHHHPISLIASKVAARSATNAIFMLCVILLIEVVFDIILPNPDCDEKKKDRENWTYSQYTITASWSYYLVY